MAWNGSLTKRKLNCHLFLVFSLVFLEVQARIPTLFMDAQKQSTDRYLTTVQWLHDRRKPLLLAGAVVVVLGLIWAFWAWTSARKEADANDAFFAAPVESGMRSLAVSPEALLSVARDYPSTPAGEHAQVLAAEQLFTEGKYPEALTQFTEFIDAYPDSALIPQAKVGLAACLEAQGKTAEAIAKYHEIISVYPSEMSIVGPAKLTLARLYEESNQLQQALTYYAELARTLNQNPNDPWASEARERAQLPGGQTSRTDEGPGRHRPERSPERAFQFRFAGSARPETGQGSRHPRHQRHQDLSASLTRGQSGPQSLDDSGCLDQFRPQTLNETDHYWHRLRRLGQRHLFCRGRPHRHLRR